MGTQLYILSAEEQKWLILFLCWPAELQGNLCASSWSDSQQFWYTPR